MRVVADSNIFISSLNFGGNPKRILDLARDGGFALLVSDDILEETARVLGKRFRWPEEDVSAALAEVSSFAEHVEPNRRVEGISRDPDDNRVLECADSGNADYIVTGDNDLLTLGSFGKTQIVTASAFLRNRLSPRR